MPAQFAACLHPPGNALDWHTKSDSPFWAPSSQPIFLACIRQLCSGQRRKGHVLSPCDGFFDTSVQEEETSPTPRAMVLSPLLVTPTIFRAGDTTDPSDW